MNDHFPDAIAIGVMDERGVVTVCPPADFVMTSTTALSELKLNTSITNYLLARSLIFAL
jgi:hypothetical protein